MTPGDWIALSAILLCFAGSVALLAMEGAIAGASHARLHAQGEAGDAEAAAAARLMEGRDVLIGALRLANLALTVTATALATTVLYEYLGRLGAGAAVCVGLVGFGLARGLSRAIPARDPERIAKAVAPPARLLMTALMPVAAALDALGAVVVHPFRGLRAVAGGGNGGTEELRGAVDLMHREGAVVKEDRDMLGGLLDLKELTLADVMVHRTKMMAIDLAEPGEAIVRQVLAAPHTRLPVYRDSPENIVGVLHARDLLRALAAAAGDAAALDIEALALPAWFVPGTTTLEDQLLAFRRRKMHFAVVVDEYGVVMGIVTLEDILEEIVGDIADEHDLAVAGVRPSPDGSVVVDGSVPIRDVNRAMDWRLPDDAATTIAGLVIHDAGIIPEPGQTFTFRGFRFQVLRKVRHRITSVRVTRLGERVARRTA